MSSTFIANVEITINAPVAQVWKALTDPEIVKQYFFGTNLVVKEWKVGGTILYKGEWQGKQYEDKGIILEYIPEKLLVTNYWSGFSGKPDVPENYQRITYTLIPVNGATKLTIKQENVPSEESKKHSEQNWAMVLDGMKKLLEK
jgi:uncharacterized protein YndB with AHSA1/START domain